MKRQNVFLHNQCRDCQHQFEDACLTHFDCSSCPMYFKPRKIRHCHCLTQITTEERKSGKCKFFKQKEVK